MWSVPLSITNGCHKASDTDEKKKKTTKHSIQPTRYSFVSTLGPGWIMHLKENGMGSKAYVGSIHLTRQPPVSLGECPQLYIAWKARNAISPHQGLDGFWRKTEIVMGEKGLPGTNVEYQNGLNRKKNWLIGHNNIISYYNMIRSYMTR